MQFPFYRQPDWMDCGPTCLQMIIKYYGKNIELQLIREKCQIGKDGVSLLGISEAAESLGFRTQAVKLNYDKLVKDATLPCILYWNQYHFVVLYKVKRNTLFVADPAYGLARFTKNEFLSRWVSNAGDEGLGEGVALLMEMTPKFRYLSSSSGTRPNDRGIINIFKYLFSYKKLIFQLLIGLCLSSILQLILPFLTKSVVDVGVTTSNIHFVYLVLLAQIALFTGRLTIEFVRNWILLKIGTRISISILTDFLIKLMNLPLSFFDSRKTGSILQRMNDHQRIQSFLTGSSINLLFSLVNLVIFSIVLSLFSVQIFLVFCTATIFYSVWIVLFLKRRKILDYKRFDLASKEQNTSIQLIQGMQEIKLNVAEKYMRWEWEKLQAKLFDLNMKSLILNQWQQSGASFLNEGKNILITFISAKAVIDGHITLGTMLAVQSIIGQLNSPIEQLISFVQSGQNAKISADRINEIHNMEDEDFEKKNVFQELPGKYSVQIAGGGMPSIDTSGNNDTIVRNPFATSLDFNFHNRNNEKGFSGIRFKDVSFTYSGAGNKPVLRNINLVIPKGKTTAIVGVSGSGKTTFLKLLLKFYEPQIGDIQLDNIPLSKIGHKVWRSQCAAVMQDGFIFSDSIARNIAVGSQAIDANKLRHAINVANIEEFIDSLPLGSETKIGVEGNPISVGQKQRILIARAIYRDPEFIFFDEATNSLDANNERVIIENLSSFFKNKTVVVVAHRLSTVKNADQIVVLKGGSIVEQGEHKELIKIKGEYFMLVKNQLDLGD
ncbi:MAG TPA: peptidase domain-containing ABC transporter [Puia sp.]|nr:peptidase domain-containing ABC transporter [Puia sp.]